MINKYNKKQLKEISNMLEKLKQPVGIIMPIDCYRNAEIKNLNVNHQSQFFF